jgi:hypothetical protein
MRRCRALCTTRIALEHPRSSCQLSQRHSLWVAGSDADSRTRNEPPGHSVNAWTPFHRSVSRHGSHQALLISNGHPAAHRSRRSGQRFNGHRGGCGGESVRDSISRGMLALLKSHQYGGWPSGKFGKSLMPAPKPMLQAWPGVQRLKPPRADANGATSTSRIASVVATHS